MRDVKRKCIIISAESSVRNDFNNKQNTDVLERYLEKYNYAYKPLIGHYKGVNECSFLVEYTDERLDMLLAWADVLDQESILKLDQDRNASLYYVNTGEEVKIGALKSLDFKEVKNLSAWSYCPVLDQYYGVA